MSHHLHRRESPKALTLAVLTVSDTRTEATDGTGPTIVRMAEDAGHTVAAYRVVPDEASVIAAALAAWLEDRGLMAVVVNGGTGVAPRDVTIEAVRPLLDKELPGFGELFRALSFEEIGAAAYLSRALCGTARGKAIYCVPGSTEAASLAMERLILPEMGHLWAMAHGAGAGAHEGGTR